MSNLKPAVSLIHATAEKTAVPLSDKQLDQIDAYCTLLAQYNEHMNLVSNAQYEVVVNDHVLDSFTLVPIIQRFRGEKAGRNSLIDIGSGAGFPGLVLAIAVPGLRVTLVEAVGKKARFLADVVSQLNLSGAVEVENKRAEELAHHGQYRARYGFATARAVGPSAIVCELSSPFLAPKGLVLVQKSAKQWTEDERAITDNVEKLGASVKEVVNLDPQISGKELVVVVLEQDKPTKTKYPRSWAEIKKSPLF
jgi:16S rRNA (guanine527-N7)-methyltransferase